VNVCPDCDRPLAQTATECRCGWQQVIVQTSSKSVAELNAEREAEHMARVREFLSANDLERRPGESVDAWRKRTLEWMKDKGIKTFGKAA
jgi:hypothetical protein